MASSSAAPSMTPLKKNRTHVPALKQSQCFNLSRSPVSSSVASSNPLPDTPNFSARSSKQLNEVEVFDMADDSSDEDMEASTPEVLSADDSTPSLPSGKSGCDTATKSPASTEAGPSSAIQNISFDDSDQGDAWAQEDWTTPRGDASRTACSVLEIEKLERRVVDTVLSELHIDLQSEVQRAVGQMASWVSDEITFARQGFEESTKIATESLVSRLADLEHETARLGGRISAEVASSGRCCDSSESRLQDQLRNKQAELEESHVKLCGEIEKLQASMDEQLLTIRKEPQECSQLRPRAQTDTQPSASVIEARMVAEERKRRMEAQKLDDLQSGLRTATQQLQDIDQQTLLLADKSAAQDASMAARISEEKKLRSGLDELHSQMNRSIERMEGLAKQCCSASEKLAVHESKIDVLSSQESADQERKQRERSEIQTSLDKQTECIRSLDKKAAYLEEKASTHSADLESQTLERSKLLAKFDELERSLDAHDERIKSLDTQSSKVSEKLKVQETSMEARLAAESNIWQCKQDELKSTIELNSQNIEALEAASAEFEKSLLEQSSRIRQQTNSESLKMDKFNKFNDRLEKLHKSHKASLDRVEAAETLLRSTAQTCEKQEAKVESFFKDTSRWREKIDSIILQQDADLQTAVAGLQTTTEDLKETKTRAARNESNIDVFTAALEDSRVRMSQHGIDIQANKEAVNGIKSQLSKAHKERLAELQIVCGKLDQHAEKLASMPGDVRDQLCTVEQGLTRTIHKLAEDVSTKAPIAAVNQAQDAMHQWVQDAQVAHMSLVDNLTRSLEQDRREYAGQGEILHKHDDWMKEMSNYLNQAQERERGLSHIVFRMVEEDYPQLIRFFEEAMTPS